MNEGLAEYTGVALSGAAARLVLRDLEDGAAKASFTRSFAYATGPAYGLLLDKYKAGWRDRVKAADELSDLLTVQVLENPPVEQYDGESLRRQEVERDHDRLLRLAKLRKLLIEGPV